MPLGRPWATIPLMQNKPSAFDPCPACGWYVPVPIPVDATCPHCAFPLTGAQAADLRELNVALATVDAERNRLLGRRAQLLAQPRHIAPPARSWEQGPRPQAGETTPLAAQNVLLSLGGVLLAVAAIAFTVISWGHLGIGGRAAVLALLTMAAMAVPALLLRRALSATAEVVACLGLVLLLLDTYAVRRTLLPGGDGTAYAAVSITVVSAVWAGYAVVMRSRAGRGLVLPAPAALVLAQLPLPLWAAADRSVFGGACALLGTAVFDGAALTALKWSGPRAFRLTAMVAGCVTGGWGLLIAGALSVRADGFGAAFRAAALLLVAAVCAVAMAYRMPVGQENDSAGWGRVRHAAWVLGVVAGLSCLAGVGGLIRVFAVGDWAVPGYLAGAAALLGVTGPAWRAGGRRVVVSGVAAGALVVHGVAAVWAMASLSVGVFGTLGWVGSVWTGAPAGARAAVPGWEVPGSSAAVVVAAEVAVVLSVIAFRGVRADQAFSGALVMGALAADGISAALDPPYAVAVGSRVALAVLLLGAARVLGGRAMVARTAVVGAVVVSVTTVGWALAERAATLSVLAVLLVAFAAAAWRAQAQQRAVAGVAAVACAAGLAWAGPLAGGWPAYGAAFVVLAVAAGALLCGVRAQERAVEYSGYGAAGLALVLAAGDAGALSAALGLAGVLAAGLALRADRRPWAGYAAAVLMVAAGWVRLGASDVTAPEAYTLPVTVAALGMGWLRRRRDPAVSSWGAYGAGLAATLLPSLVTAWGDAHWLRPMLLGVGALVVTLLGARYRLQAPLLLGGVVLALDALHELAPFVLQVLGVLPRWLPLALAGVVLLAAGATYEQRLRDVRRVRDAFNLLR